jgi:hypothetical protein
MHDGHLNKCKECTKLDVTKHRATNLDKIQQYDNQRSQLPHRVELRRKATLAYPVLYPEKATAHNRVAAALRDGRLFKQPCVECGSLEVEAHHEDYSKPLDVVWLCTKHHHARHRKWDYEQLLGQRADTKQP